MHKNPKVFLITAVNNHWEFTKLFLKCANRQDYKNHEIIVVDDGSTDGTSEKIFKLYPKVRLLKGDGNLWWTGSLFIALEFVRNNCNKDDFFLTINNDCSFPSNYISNLVTSAQKFDKSIIGSVAVSRKNRKKIIDSGAKINWLRGSVLNADLINRYNFNIDALSTRGTIFPVSILNEVGNFDKDRLPHYVSDFEYTCRAKRNGYRLITDSKSIVVNDDTRTGTSGPMDKPISTRELYRILFDRKSQINIIDHFNFINLCCPWHLRPLNCFYLIAKLIYLASFLPLFFPMRRPIVKLRSLLINGVK